MNKLKEHPGEDALLIYYQGLYTCNVRSPFMAP